MHSRKSFSKEDIYREVIEAEKRIRKYIRKTYLDYSKFFSSITNNNVYLKLENTQITGSFKLRGAFNSILSLSPDKKRGGIITASTGNHGKVRSY